MHVIRKVKANKEQGFVADRTINLYQDGRLNELLQGFSNAVQHHNTSVVMICDGKSGMGKSTLSFQIGLALDKDFGLHKIHFQPKTFLEGDEHKIGLANAPKNSCIIFDEAMLISNRSSMSAINKMIVQGMSMIRSKNIYVIFCVNSIFDLDRNLVLHRADVLFHIYGQTLIDRGRFCAFFRGKDGSDKIKMLYLYGKKFYDYRKPTSNFIGRFTKEFVVDENLYEVQKQIGVNAFLAGTQRKSFDKYKVIIELKKRGMKVVDIAQIVSFDKTQVWRILRENEKNLENYDKIDRNGI